MQLMSCWWNRAGTLQGVHQEAVAELNSQIASAKEALVSAQQELEAKQAVSNSLQEQLSEAQEKTAGLEVVLGELRHLHCSRHDS